MGVHIIWTVQFNMVNMYFKFYEQIHFKDSTRDLLTSLLPKFFFKINGSNWQQENEDIN